MQCILEQIEAGKGEELFVPFTWEGQGDSGSVLASFAAYERPNGEICGDDDDSSRFIMVRGRGQQALDACIAGRNPKEVMKEWRQEIWQSRKRRSVSPLK